MTEKTWCAVRHLASAYQNGLQTCTAVMLVGSVAEGMETGRSDVDIRVFHDPLPCQRGLHTPGEVFAATDRLQATDGPLVAFTQDSIREIGTSERTMYVEAFWWRGINFEAWHVSSRVWEEEMYRMMQGRIADAVALSEVQVAARSVLLGVTLFEEPIRYDLMQRGWASGLQDLVRTYPRALRKRMVEEYLQPIPFRELEQAAAEGDPDLGRRLYCVTEQLIGALMGLNSLYHSPRVRKRLGSHIARMRFVPPDLCCRIDAVRDACLGIESVQEPDPEWAVLLLGELVDEVFALAEKHGPDVDLTAARRRWEGGLTEGAVPKPPSVCAEIFRVE